MPGIPNSDPICELKVCRGPSHEGIGDAQDREGDGNEPEPRPRVSEVWPGAPCGDDIVVPPPWECGEFGIHPSKGESIREKVVIARMLEEIEGPNMRVELAFERGDRWIHLTCPRSQIASTMAIIKLADQGLPVNSKNAGTLVEYLSDLERCNRETIPLTRLAKRCGWFDTGEFLCGQEVTGGNGKEELRFEGDDAGDNQLVAGIRRGGTIDGWLEAVALISDAPRAQLILYAGLVPALLPIIDAPNFILSLEGPTSRGKSTSQMLAASCWGYPTPNGPDGPPIIFSWNATPIRTERAAGILCGIPLILDDTNSVPRSKRSDITAALYQFGNGSGRGRASRHGLAATHSWQSVLISSGEEPLTSFSNDGGTRARTLPLWGSPFPQGPDTGRMVVDLREGLSEHFGHAGPAFVVYLTANRDRWPQWRDVYRQLRRRFAQRAGQNVVAGRLAAPLAALELAGRIAHEAINLPWEYVNVVDALWSDLTSGTDEADQAVVVLRALHSWAVNNRDRFQDELAKEAPSSRVLGQWVWTGKDREDPCLLFFPHQLDAVLRQLGYMPAGIRKQWKDRGWLRCEAEKTTVRATINGNRCAMAAIRWSVLDQLMNEDDPPGSAA